MISHEEFEAEAGKIDYQYAHLPVLHAIALWTRPLVCVEVGTHIGMAAVWIARALQENGTGGHLICIDNFCWREHEQEKQWQSNIDRCGVRDVVHLLRGRSQEVEWPDRVDLCYVDGNHSYEVVKHDAEKARELGASVIVLHDTVACEGPREVVRKIRHGQYNGWGMFDMIEDNADSGLTILKRREPKPPVDPNDTSDLWDVQK